MRSASMRWRAWMLAMTTSSCSRMASGIVQAAVGQDVGLGAPQEPDRHRLLHPRDLFPLRVQPVDVEASGVEGGGRVVGDGQIPHAHRVRGARHLRDGVLAVGVDGVAVDEAPQIVGGDEVVGQAPGLGRLDLAAALPQLGRDVRQAEVAVEILLAGGGHARAGRLRGETLGTEREPALAGHTREARSGGRPSPSRRAARRHSDPAPRRAARAGRRRRGPRSSFPPPGPRRRPRGATPARGRSRAPAARAAATKTTRSTVSARRRSAPAISARITPGPARRCAANDSASARARSRRSLTSRGPSRVADPLEEAALRLLAHALDTAHPSLFAGLLELGDGLDAERGMKCPDLVEPEAGDPAERERSRRHPLAKGVQRRRAARPAAAPRSWPRSRDRCPAAR